MAPGPLDNWLVHQSQYVVALYIPMLPRSSSYPAAVDDLLIDHGAHTRWQQGRSNLEGVGTLGHGGGYLGSLVYPPVILADTR